MTTPSSADLRKRLERILGDSLQQAENLDNALQAERAALSANDAGCLAEATAAKGEPIARLAVLESERATVSREAGFDASPAGMDALFESCDENSLLTSLWHRLIALASTCEQRNATNGAIIRLRRQQVRAGLAILRGGEIAAETYVPAGVEMRPPGGRALAQV